MAGLDQMVPLGELDPFSVPSLSSIAKQYDDTFGVPDDRVLVYDQRLIAAYLPPAGPADPPTLPLLPLVVPPFTPLLSEIPCEELGWEVPSASKVPDQYGGASSDSEDAVDAAVTRRQFGDPGSQEQARSICVNTDFKEEDCNRYT